MMIFNSYRSSSAFLWHPYDPPGANSCSFIEASTKQFFCFITSIWQRKLNCIHFALFCFLWLQMIPNFCSRQSQLSPLLKLKMVTVQLLLKGSVARTMAARWAWERLIGNHCLNDQYCRRPTVQRELTMSACTILASQFSTRAWSIGAVARERPQNSR